VRWGGGKGGGRLAGKEEEGGGSELLKGGTANKGTSSRGVLQGWKTKDNRMMQVGVGPASSKVDLGGGTTDVKGGRNRPRRLEQEERGELLYRVNPHTIRTGRESGRRDG